MTDINTCSFTHILVLSLICGLRRLSSPCLLTHRKFLSPQSVLAWFLKLVSQTGRSSILFHFLLFSSFSFLVLCSFCFAWLVDQCLFFCFDSMFPNFISFRHTFFSSLFLFIYSSFSSFSFHTNFSFYIISSISIVKC